MNASTGGIGRPRTNSARASTYSGRAAYSSGVRQKGKIDWMTISVTLSRALATIRQPSTMTLRNGSVLSQALCSDSVFASSGYLAASHVPADAPSETPKMCAGPTPAACMNAATSSASSSVVYSPSGLLDSPAPRRSTL